MNPDSKSRKEGGKQPSEAPVVNDDRVSDERKIDLEIEETQKQISRLSLILEALVTLKTQKSRRSRSHSTFENLREPDPVPASSSNTKNRRHGDWHACRCGSSIDSHRFVSFVRLLLLQLLFLLALFYFNPTPTIIFFFFLFIGTPTILWHWGC